MFDGHEKVANSLRMQHDSVASYYLLAVDLTVIARVRTFSEGIIIPKPNPISIGGGKPR
jgi:hypothetical protein